MWGFSPGKGGCCGESLVKEGKAGAACAHSCVLGGAASSYFPRTGRGEGWRHSCHNKPSLEAGSWDGTGEILAGCGGRNSYRSPGNQHEMSKIKYQVRREVGNF